MRAMAVIDVHCHIVPEHFPDAHARSEWPCMRHLGNGRASIMIAEKEYRAVNDRCWDPMRRLADMDTEGVSIQVLSPMPELLSYWFAASDALEMAQHVNKAIATMTAAAPRRFVG